MAELSQIEEAAKQRKDATEISSSASVPGSQTSASANPEKEAPPTTGERFYNMLQFSVGKVAILVATAVLAYTAKYGKDSYGSAPNFLKKFQTGFHNKLLNNSVYPLADKGELANRVAGAAANTMVTFHGGNAFAPIMKSMENNQEQIAVAVDKRFGKPGEAEISHERLKDKPKQNWGDVLKGRFAAWATVFTGFMAADTVIGKDKKTGMHWFDKYEEGFGRWVAGFTKGGKELAKVPVHKPLTAVQDANKLYRLGKIAALDIYATSAAIVIWSAVSRSSAEKRLEKNKTELAAQPAEEKIVTEHAPAIKKGTESKLTAKISPRKPVVAQSTEGFASNIANKKASLSEASII